MHHSVRTLGAFPIQHSLQKLQQHVYDKLALQFSHAPRARIGLAISGGVDSMALATICHGFKKEHNQYDFTGFIVDHGVRPDSAEEALKVTDELRNLGIEAEILKLDWSGHENPKVLPNFETIARRLRYQALGKACYRQRITNILTAHHKNDLAETVLSRIIAGYLGEGLQGIKSTAALPESQGIYGVDASGAPRVAYPKPGSRGLLIESGGVYLDRPLLSFTKHDLIEMCQQNKVRWFEDSTNADKTLTVRNTIRHLHSSGHLPAALQRPRLISLALSLRHKHRLHEQLAAGIWNNMHIQLHPATGTAKFSFPQDFSFDSLEESQSYHVKAVLARQLLNLVSPLQTISLQDLDSAIDTFCTPAKKEAKLQTQGVAIHYTRLSTPHPFLIQRQNPTRNSLRPTELGKLKPIPSQTQKGGNKTPTHATDWTLWDNRYWIRILHTSSPSPSPTSPPPPPPDLHFSLTFLTPSTTHHLRASVSTNPKTVQTLQTALKKAATSRPSQPVLSVRIASEAKENVLALPALGWERREILETWGLSWEVRYKAVNFEQTERHVLVE